MLVGDVALLRAVLHLQYGLVVPAVVLAEEVDDPTHVGDRCHRRVGRKRDPLGRGSHRLTDELSLIADGDQAKTGEHEAVHHPRRVQSFH